MVFSETRKVLESFILLKNNRKMVIRIGVKSERSRFLVRHDSHFFVIKGILFVTEGKIYNNKPVNVFFLTYGTFFTYVKIAEMFFQNGELWWKIRHPIYIFLSQPKLIPKSKFTIDQIIGSIYYWKSIIFLKRAGFSCIVIPIR